MLTFLLTALMYCYYNSIATSSVTLPAIARGLSKEVLPLPNPVSHETDMTLNVLKDRGAVRTLIFMTRPSFPMKVCSDMHCFTNIIDRRKLGSKKPQLV